MNPLDEYPENIREVIRLVCEELGVDTRAITEPFNSPRSTKARRVTYALCFRATCWSWNELATHFRRGKSTIVNAAAAAELEHAALLEELEDWLFTEGSRPPAGSVCSGLSRKICLRRAVKVPWYPRSFDELSDTQRTILVDLWLNNRRLLVGGVDETVGADLRRVGLVERRTQAGYWWLTKRGLMMTEEWFLRVANVPLAAE